jgi:predicted DNA-binding transcriptional regulator YafY
VRADRLISELLLMQSRGRVTAAELAAEVGVSVATARRDLEALSAAGVPVYPQAGRGGGWQLVGGARTNLSGLSAPEARALFTLAGPAAEVSEQAKTALRKLVRALPATFRADAESAAKTTIIDPSRWGGTPKARPALVGQLQSAVVARRRVQITYTNSARAHSVRMVDPWGLIDKDGIWYLIAGTEAGQRSFRVDRIADAETTSQPASWPDDFTLTAAWEHIVHQIEQRRSRTWATVLIETRFASILRDHFGRHFRIDKELGSQRVQVRVGAPTPRDIARNLAGWGSLVRVIEPETVQAELARIGAELVASYGPPE